MNIRHKLSFTIILIVFSIVSCEVNTSLPFEKIPEIKKKYHASMESINSGTRASLTNENMIVWGWGDCISVFNQNDTMLRYSASESSYGKPNGEFEYWDYGPYSSNGLNFDETIAFYPEYVFSGCGGVLYQDSINKHQFYIDGLGYSEYEYILPRLEEEDGYYITGHLPMIAICSADQATLSFQNIFGILKLSLKGDRQIKEIIIEGNNGEALSGPCVISISIDAPPTISMIDEYSHSSVTLSCLLLDERRITLNKDTATVIYVSIPPTDFTGGFNVTIIDIDENKYIKKTEKRNIVKRSSILAMPTFSIHDDGIIVEELPNIEGKPAEDFEFTEGEW